MCADLIEHGVEGVDEFGAAAVIQGDDEFHAGVVCREAHACFDILADGFGELFGAADDQEANVIFVDGREFAL